MNDTKSIESGTPETASRGRRSFIRKAGGALSALFATGAVAAPTIASGARDLQEEVKRLNGQLGALEDEAALRRLHQNYAEFLEQRDYEALLGLFTPDAEVHFNDKLHTGRDTGLSRLYIDLFGRGLQTGYAGPVPRRLQADPERQEMIAIAPDRASATATFPHLMQIWSLDPVEYPAMDLARAQGQGILRTVERGEHYLHLVKESGTWKIRRLEYRSAGTVEPAAAWRV